MSLSALMSSERLSVSSYSWLTLAFWLVMNRPNLLTRGWKEHISRNVNASQECKRDAHANELDIIIEMVRKWDTQGR